VEKTSASNGALPTLAQQKDRNQLTAKCATMAVMVLQLEVLQLLEPALVVVWKETISAVPLAIGTHA